MDPSGRLFLEARLGIRKVKKEKQKVHKNDRKIFFENNN